MKINTKMPGKLLNKNFFEFLFSPRMSLKEQTLFAKRLSYLMRAGVPILESLNLLKQQMPSKVTKVMFEKIIIDVSNGQFLSTAMTKFKGSFSSFVINIIKIGETSGILDHNLEYLADELKKKQLLRQKILGAMFYPIFIVATTFGLAIILTLVVFPKVMPIFSSVKIDLPFTTKILIGVSKFLLAYGWLVALVLAAVPIIFFVCMKNESFRITLEKLILKLPIFGRMALSYQLSNFCRTLGLLIKGDSRLQEALLTTSASTDNLIYRYSVEKLAMQVSKGKKISEFMLENKILFPDMVSHMVAVGEKTGNLSDTFLYLAEIYEQELDDLTKNLSSMLEPVLMIFMGVMVGFVAISIITPIYSVTQKLTR